MLIPEAWCVPNIFGSMKIIHTTINMVSHTAPVNFRSEQLSGGHPVHCSGFFVFLTNHFLIFFFRPFLRGVDCEAVPLEVPSPVTGGMKVEPSSDSPVPISTGGRETRDSDTATGGGTEVADTEG